MIEITEKEKNLIDLALKYVFDCCGDGWALIVSKDYQRLADVFESLNSDYEGNYKRQEPVYDSITFQGLDEEAVTFSRSMRIDDPEVHEFIAIV